MHASLEPFTSPNLRGFWISPYTIINRKKARVIYRNVGGGSFGKLQQPSHQESAQSTQRHATMTNSLRQSCDDGAGVAPGGSVGSDATHLRALLHPLELLITQTRDYATLSLGYLPEFGIDFRVMGGGARAHDPL